MATANELFAANGEDYIVIDSDLRTMTFPASVNNIGVENDKDVHKLNFKMPRYFSGYDLSTFNIRINYLNAQGNGDMYVVTDPTVEEDAIYFTWLVGRHACLYRGAVTFIVCLKLADGEGDVTQEYNTTLASLQVLPGLETEPAILENDYDIIEQLLLTIQDTNGKIKAVLDSGMTAEELGDIAKEQKTLKSRMDEFASLPDGSTAGDAELTDIRVGADGTVYGNAGTAVRDQVGNLKSALSDIEEITVKTTEHTETTDITSDLTFTDGYVDADGNIGSSANYKYTEHISVSEGDIIFTTSGSYSLRYITAYNGNNVESSKSASNVLTYTVPSGVDSVIVTVYSATGLVAGTVNKTVTTVETRNINDEAISEIKNNTIYERTNSTDITASLTFTNGYVNKQGLVVSGSSTYKYSARISVSEGDVFSTAEHPFRYVTAYNGTAIEAKSAEDVMSYTVPSGISEIILTMYIASTRGVMKGVKEPYNLFYNSLSQKNVGYFEKPYICLSCDDGADELVTYTIPMIISKGVPCTFGLYKTSPVFQHGHTQTVVNAVNNNNCDVAQHGGQYSWTDYNAEELVAFFDDEEQFWKSIGVDVKSAIYPTHLSNPMVRAITGSRFGCCRSGYDYDGILYYDDETKPSGTFPYYATGARSNLYAMSSWNMPAGKDLQFTKNCIDWAIANNKLIHFYWHDWDLDSVSKQVLEDAIDYAKTQNINFIKLSEVPYIK